MEDQFATKQSLKSSQHILPLSTLLILMCSRLKILRSLLPPCRQHTIYQMSVLIFACTAARWRQRAASSRCSAPFDECRLGPGTESPESGYALKKTTQFAMHSPKFRMDFQNNCDNCSATSQNSFLELTRLKKSVLNRGRFRHS